MAAGHKYPMLSQPLDFNTMQPHLPMFLNVTTVFVNVMFKRLLTVLGSFTLSNVDNKSHLQSSQISILGPHVIVTIK